MQGFGLTRAQRLFSEEISRGRALLIDLRVWKWRLARRSNHLVWFKWWYHILVLVYLLHRWVFVVISVVIGFWLCLAAWANFYHRFSWNNPCTVSVIAFYVHRMIQVCIVSTFALLLSPWLFALLLSPRGYFLVFKCCSRSPNLFDFYLLVFFLRFKVANLTRSIEYLLRICNTIPVRQSASNAIASHSITSAS